jgi:hypothetical protein
VGSYFMRIAKAFSEKKFMDDILQKIFFIKWRKKDDEKVEDVKVMS